MAPPARYIRLFLYSLGFAQTVAAGLIREQAELLHFRLPSDVTAGSLHNIHVDYIEESFEGDVQLVYGDCDIVSSAQAHHDIGTLLVKRDARPERFVWITPSDAPHLSCLHAFSGSSLLGRSKPVSVVATISKRTSIADVADAEGPWFDGVAYMKGKEPGKAVVANAKEASVAIIGGGMAGLMTSLLLESVGIHDWHIIESSGRVGGRIRTKYLNHTRPNEYQYQEMGPMRFPVSITYPDTNETLQIQDHRMVFQLANTVNKLNNDKSDLKVNFIPFIQQGENLPAPSGGNRLPNGRIPTSADVSAHPSLVYTPKSSNETAVEDAEGQFSEFTKVDERETMRQLAKNMYKAHKAAIEDGMFHWSETAYLSHALGFNSNITDYVAGTDDSPIWHSLYDAAYFAATEWRTIDQGLESLPRAIYPLVANRTTLNRKVEGLSYDEASGKIAVQTRNDPFQTIPESKEYDYAVVAAPFSKVRLWDLPRYSSLLSRAISTMNYDQSCKVALQYETRFWEHQENPIFGGCGSVDVPGVGNVCYPSYNLNGTGPGVVLASYISGTPARSTAALSTEDHVAMVQRSMVEIHGPIAAEQYTGIFERQCWEVDEHQAGAWASPLVGQQELYLPAYYQTEFKTIFIGEHTSYTHAWIFSALDSAVRGTTQLLLDLGLVDEAKSVVNEWMGRWIKL
ncbi:flavin-containing amine oxidoreductase-domain containing protein [Aspergillus taichungensis]|uniref:Flavin-containing amine oxidoreductase-domain containing protein n=1 Tax=Aspergillus taichungensis TaxID=482145 RepID=A0A2J5HJ47_9EURO|nr:flavin-containing amine oxidoreductase-domain containing protein [Aspergillus taichungensis]